MKPVHKIFKIIVFTIYLVLPLSLWAKEWKNEGVRILYEELGDGKVRVTDIFNYSGKKITPVIDGEVQNSINNESSGKYNKIAFKSFGYYSSKSSGYYNIPQPKPKKVEEEQTVGHEVGPKETETAKPTYKNGPKDINANSGRTVQSDDDLSYASVNYLDKLEEDPVLSEAAVDAHLNTVSDYISGISNSSNKRQYIIDNDLELFLKNSQAVNDEVKSQIPAMARAMLSGLQIPYVSKEENIRRIEEIAFSRLQQREEACSQLKEAMEDVDQQGIGFEVKKEDIINYIIVGSLILIVLLWVIIAIIRKRKKKEKKKKSRESLPIATQASQDIVVRRRTTSILKKLDLSDVVNNPAYFNIQTKDFTPDSAVKNIYIKNSCIREVYNLYAEDLRNIDNPKEDGCMVLGRWTYNDKDHTYDVSLEDVVFPGDDAIFQEYELNFGGKIKLKIAERLRKLRKETNLQYDLTCWIHSHPGLGVFFSNSDSNVQMQLKHAQHPNFLIAIVVDILTSDQELGIFTFRKDGSIISKGDLSKMYSLEEMYKWALTSERTTFNPEKYYNLLNNAVSKTPSCAGVELNNNAIIDLTQIVVEPDTGLVGWGVGYSVKGNKGEEMVISEIVGYAEKPVSGVLGALVIVSHMSLLTIQRLISKECNSLNFVMVYSTKQMTLTTVPVINGELERDEKYYGDVNIDDLRIWTRRKR